MKREFGYKLLLLTISLGLLLPNLGTTGIFGDGLIYAVVSRNFAQGLGDFWALYYSDQIFSPFAEHPPLLFWLEACWFSLVGDYHWTEKSFSVGLGILMFASLRHFWKNLASSSDIARFWWFPLLLWIVVPTIHWAYPNNMLENLLVLFTSWAIWKAYRIDDYRAGLWVGVLVFLAFMTKGLVGLFPLAVFGIKQLSLKSPGWGKAIGWSALSTAVFLILFGITLLFEPAREGWYRYFDNQLFATFKGERAIQDHVEGLPRYYILLRVFTELFNPLLILIVLVLAARSMSIKRAYITDKKHILFFLFVALSATLPLLVSPKQHSFYLIPAIPWFIFALTLASNHLTFPLFDRWKTSHWSYTFMQIVFGVLLFATLLISYQRSGKPGRDDRLMKDIAQMAAFTSGGGRIGMPDYLIRHHSLHAYFQRNHRISLYPDDLQAKFWITEKDSLAPEGYFESDLTLEQYSFFEKSSN